ncbi:predicted protein [Nematostella vectensis]|uniref:Uncharacterized protein n=1 Tax=Nematostella vectensis TaxID=45351 RepID=A7SVN3_NEMVE|nr:predicted protein [Nematostella vectensis]|eukprot:XP_001624337.1 predicted protein [Nematostella vectensis]
MGAFRMFISCMPTSSIKPTTCTISTSSMPTSNMGLVYASEQLNILGERHWRKFAREQYFDSSGLFISVILSVPVLFNCFVILVSWLWTACSMLIVVGKGRVREKQRQLVKEAKEEEKKKIK